MPDGNNIRQKGFAMDEYKGKIKNVTSGKWLKSESKGVIKETRFVDKALIFWDQEDAEETLEFLNDTYESCYTLIDNSDCE